MLVSMIMLHRSGPNTPTDDEMGHSDTEQEFQ